MSRLKVYAFSPRWGLPTAGPFALKLLAWLEENAIAYELIPEDRSDRGPLGKSPWIEHDGTRLGDSDAIIAHLSERRSLPDPFAMASAADACGQALKLAFEERFHQILEWELFVHPAGGEEITKMIHAAAPPVLGTIISRRLIRHFSRQLKARGIGRLDDDAIAREGERLLTMLRLCLADGREWLSGGEAPGLVDFAVWGQVAPMIAWPMDTPVASSAKAIGEIVQWHARVQARSFASSAREAA